MIRRSVWLLMCVGCACLCPVWLFSTVLYLVTLHYYWAAFYAVGTLAFAYLSRQAYLESLRPPSGYHSGGHRR